MDDHGLLARVKRGDEEAFSELYARHQAAIYRYAAHMCGPAAADDVVQETFLALLRRPQAFDAARGTVAAYLYGIARHNVLGRLSVSHAELADAIETEEGFGAAVESSPLDALSRAETIARVRAAIGSLPPAYREAVVLCELQEMDYAAAAAVMQCPIGTVRSRLHRARGLLMSKLAERQPVVAGKPGS